MSAVRQELLEQIDKLDESQQQQLLDYVRVQTTSRLTWAEWLALAEQSRNELSAKYGDQHYFDSQSVGRGPRETNF